MDHNKFYLALIYPFLFLNLTSCDYIKDKKIFSPQNNSLSAKEIYNDNVNNTVTVFSSTGQGSGFFIDKDLIVTNYHVVKNAKSAEIILNNIVVR